MGHGIGGQGIVARLKGMANYELVPVIFCVSAVCMMATAFSGYSLFKKTDVALFKKSTPHPWVKVRETQPQKFLTLNQKYRSNPVIEELQREVGSRK
ncbi:normal mucosa of esophagus-specific gene 1 protein-like [Diadema antillarum]|uniref:normal mucosa of esophagus-specific gene 1 protein-like n=1 Tax=Diadema antillarum TaxID=105358 RepID=UPI003A857F9E